MSATPNFIIRPPKQSDISQVLKLVTAIGYPITQEDMQFRLKLYGKDKLNRSWVAQKSNSDKIVGWVAVSVSKRILEPTISARIVSLIVDETFRRQGIAKRLMQEVEHYSETIGCKTLELVQVLGDIPGYEAFYQKLGYKNSSETKEIVQKSLA